MRVELVAGTEDEYLPPAFRERDRERLAAVGLSYEDVTFEGGHRLDKDTLVRVARTPGA